MRQTEGYQGGRYGGEGLGFQSLRINRKQCARAEEFQLMGARYGGEDTVIPELFLNKDYQVVICISIYNENWMEFVKTMKGVLRYIKECEESRHPDPQEIAVMAIVDGYDKMDRELKKNLSKIGLYNEQRISEEFFEDRGEAKKKFAKYMYVQDQTREHYMSNCMHVFHSKMNKAQIGEFAQGENFSDVPFMHFYFCVKHMNGGKLDTHFWFFRGFCPMINPSYIVLLDVGTEPFKNSIRILVDEMTGKKNIGGCCGEVVMKSSMKDVGEWFLVATQFVEFKFAHYLDKTFETLFGFISVLPGCFSAYKYEAIKGAPLKNYFLGLDKHHLGMMHANMYQAEDRILCINIVIKKDSDYVLRYIPTSKAKTDAQTNFVSLLKQRRRWINGTSFVSLYCLKKIWDVCSSKHNMCRKAMFSLYDIYSFFNSIMLFFVVGLFYVCFSIFMRATFTSWWDHDADDFREADHPVCILENLYLLCLFLELLLAMGMDISRCKTFFVVISWILGIFNVLMIFTGCIYFFTTDLDSADKTVSFIMLIVILCSYLIPIFLNWIVSFWKCKEWFFFFTGLVAFLGGIPLYTNVMVIYAFCNMHDVTWGTRQGSDAEKKVLEMKTESYKMYRTYFIIIWLFANIVLAYTVNYLSRNSAVGDTILTLIMVYVCLIIVFKLVGMMINWVFHLKYHCHGSKHKGRRDPPKKNQSINRPTQPMANAAPAQPRAHAAMV